MAPFFCPKKSKIKFFYILWVETKILKGDFFMAREIEELMEAVQMLEVLNREKDEFSLDTSMIHIDTDGIKNEVVNYS